MLCCLVVENMPCRTFMEGVCLYVFIYSFYIPLWKVWPRLPSPIITHLTSTGTAVVSSSPSVLWNAPCFHTSIPVWSSNYTGSPDVPTTHWERKRCSHAGAGEVHAWVQQHACVLEQLIHFVTSHTVKSPVHVEPANCISSRPARTLEIMSTVRCGDRPEGEKLARDYMIAKLKPWQTWLSARMNLEPLTCTIVIIVHQHYWGSP